jgi:hypothetical protein
MMDLVTIVLMFMPIITGFAMTMVPFVIPKKIELGILLASMGVSIWAATH